MEVCNLSLSKSEKEFRLKKRNNTKHGEYFDEDTRDFFGWCMMLEVGEVDEFVKLRFPRGSAWPQVHSMVNHDQVFPSATMLRCESQTHLRMGLHPRTYNINTRTKVL